MSKIYDSILECIGKTPIIRLNKIGKDLPHQMLVKVEAMNPGSSIKDRIALHMVNEAEKSGELKPGGTIIECTSGNTGMGLAMVAAVRNYRCVFVMPDKVSDEKIKSLRAFGARVITTPTAVEPDDPRSYYSVAKRLAKEIPKSLYINQYGNSANPEAHYHSTGPEIWEQLGDELDVLVVTIGTGGTASGIAKYLKEKKPALKVIGIDPVGSIYYEYFKTGNTPKLLTTYKVEGFGEDFIPSTIDFELIDEVIQVSDQECFSMTRDITEKEGIFVGGSCGGAIVGAIKAAKSLKGKQTILTILPDSGSRYLSKIYDDEWMRENGFLEVQGSDATVRDLLGKRPKEIFTTTPDASVVDIVRQMKTHSISQLPVLRNEKVVGVVSERELLNAMVEGRLNPQDTILGFVEEDLFFVSLDDRVRELLGTFREKPLGIVMDGEKWVGVVTKIDLIDYLTQAGM